MRDVKVPQTRTLQWCVSRVKADPRDQKVVHWKADHNSAKRRSNRSQPHVKWQEDGERYFRDGFEYFPDGSYYDSQGWAWHKDGEPFYNDQGQQERKTVNNSNRQELEPRDVSVEFVNSDAEEGSDDREFDTPENQDNQGGLATITSRVPQVESNLL